MFLYVLSWKMQTKCVMRMNLKWSQCNSNWRPVWKEKNGIIVTKFFVLRCVLAMFNKGFEWAVPEANWRERCSHHKDRNFYPWEWERDSAPERCSNQVCLCNTDNCEFQLLVKKWGTDSYSLNLILSSVLKMHTLLCKRSARNWRRSSAHQKLTNKASAWRWLQTSMTSTEPRWTLKSGSSSL